MPLRLIQTINTFLFPFSSPDASGIVFLDDSNRLLISDSEVEETPLFAGVNLNTVDFDGNVVNSGSTLTFSAEPTGLSYDLANETLFVSDDATRKIYQVTAGEDGFFGTSDDSLINQFLTRTFNSDDPEDVAFHPALKTLFIADGSSNQIYEVDTKGNLINSFSTAIFGLSDPEGIGVHPESGNLFIVGEPTQELFEVSVKGDLVQVIDIGLVKPVQPAGVTIAPTSNDPSNKSFYIADRGIDESINLNQSDGKVYEFAIDKTIFATVRDSIELDGQRFEDEDIIAYSASTGTWSQYIDGSDLGLADNDIDGVHVNDDGSVLLSLNQDGYVGGIGLVDDADILRFIPTATGDRTEGTFEKYFDGSDVGLNANSEDIDAVSIAPNGDILLSTNGAYEIKGLTGKDEDILAFSPWSLGEHTRGSFSMYVNGSDFQLDNGRNEDIKGISVLDNGRLVVSTLGDFKTIGLSGNGGDLFYLEPGSLNENSNNESKIESKIFSDSSANGFENEVLADFSIF